MKILTIVIIGMMACGLLFTAAFAAHEGDVESAALLSGNVEKGMKLFNDTDFIFNGILMLRIAANYS